MPLRFGADTSFICHPPLGVYYIYISGAGDIEVIKTQFLPLRNCVLPAGQTGIYSDKAERCWLEGDGLR